MTATEVFLLHWDPRYSERRHQPEPLCLLDFSKNFSMHSAYILANGVVSRALALEVGDQTYRHQSFQVWTHVHLEQFQKGSISYVSIQGCSTPRPQARSGP